MFGIQLKNIYGMHNIYGINSIHDNDINRIYKRNLLHDILNHSKCVKNTHYNYYLILHGCINASKGKAKY